MILDEPRAQRQDKIVNTIQEIRSKLIQDKSIKDNTRQGKTRRDKTRQDETREEGDKLSKL